MDDKLHDEQHAAEYHEQEVLLVAGLHDPLHGDLQVQYCTQFVGIKQTPFELKGLPDH